MSDDLTPDVHEQTAQEADLAIVEENRPADALADELAAEFAAADKEGSLTDGEELDADITVSDIASDIAAAADEAAAKKAKEADAAVTAAEAALGDKEAVQGEVEAAEAEAAAEAEEDEAQKAYKARLRTFMRELRRLPGSWYIIQCYSGYENRVKTNIDTRAQTLEVEDSIYDTVVPMEEVIEIKDGKRKLVKRKLLPGYVLIRMDINDRSWSLVRDTPGVTSFVGSEAEPTPVKPRDVAKFLLPPENKPEDPAVSKDGQVVATAPQVVNLVEVDFQVGETIEIIEGPLANVSGTIIEIDPERGSIKALVSIFGRDTPTDLKLDNVRKTT